jgi:hypothetical protein
MVNPKFCGSNFVVEQIESIPFYQLCGKFTRVLAHQIFTFIIYVLYWKYWFHSKNFEIIFLLLSIFLPIKSHKTWKNAIKKIPSFTRRHRRWQEFVPHLQPRP